MRNQISAIYNAIKPKIQYRKGGEIDPENPFVLPKDDATSIADYKTWWLSKRGVDASKSCSGGTCVINTNVIPMLGVKSLYQHRNDVADWGKKNKEPRITNISKYGGTDSKGGNLNDSWNFAGAFKIAGNYKEYMKDGKVIDPNIPVGAVVNIMYSNPRTNSLNRDESLGLGDYSHTAQVAFYDSKGTPYVIDQSQGLEAAEPLSEFLKKTKAGGASLVWSPLEYSKNTFENVKQFHRNTLPPEAKKTISKIENLNNRKGKNVFNVNGEDLNWLEKLGINDDLSVTNGHSFNSESVKKIAKFIAPQISNYLFKNEAEDIVRHYPNLSLKDVVGLTQVTPFIAQQENHFNNRSVNPLSILKDNETVKKIIDGDSSPSVGGYQLRKTSLPNHIKDRFDLQENEVKFSNGTDNYTGAYALNRKYITNRSEAIEDLPFTEQSVLALNVLAENASNIKRALLKDKNAFKDVAPNMNIDNYLSYVPYFYNNGSFNPDRKRIEALNIARDLYKIPDETYNKILKDKQRDIDKGSYAAKIIDHGRAVYGNDYIPQPEKTKTIPIQKQIDNIPSSIKLPGGQILKVTPQMKTVAKNMFQYFNR